MTRSIRLTIILVLTLIVWSWVGYRVLAVQTGRLGSVTVQFGHLDQANKYIQWSPAMENYQFTPQHQLILPPKSTALFLLNPPKRFKRGTVGVIADGPVDLTAEYPPGSPPPINISASRTWRWSDVTRFPGGHRLHIVNGTDKQILVKEIKLRFIP